MSQQAPVAALTANISSSAASPSAPQAAGVAGAGPFFGAGAAPVVTTDAFDVAASCDPLHTHATMTSFPQAPWATVAPAAQAPTTATAGADQAQQAQAQPGQATPAHQQTLLAAPPAFLTAAAAQPYMVNAAGQITPAPSQQQQVLGAPGPAPSPHQQQQFVMTLPQHHPFILQQPAASPGTATAAGGLPQQPQQAMIVTGPNGQQMILGPAAAATLMQQAAVAQQPQAPGTALSFPGAPSPIAAAPPTTVPSPPGRAPDAVPSSVNTAGQKRKVDENAMDAQQLAQRLKVDAPAPATHAAPVATTTSTAPVPVADDMGTAISLSSSVATPASSAASSGSVVPAGAPTAAAQPQPPQPQQQILVPVIPHVAPQSTVSNPVLVSSDGTMSVAAPGSVSSLAQVTAAPQAAAAPLPKQDDGLDKLGVDMKLPDLSHLPPEERRRYERNQREQQRSHKISQQIKELRDVLSQSNIPFKPNKFSILLSVVNYIKQLQARAVLLDAEHRKLINTVRQTTDIVNSGQSPESLAATNNPAGSASGGAGGAAAPAASATPTVGNDADLLFVQGLDYKSVFEQCSAAMGVAALDGRFIACNNEFEVISGYSKEEITRQSLFNLVTSKDMEEVFNVMGAMLKGEAGAGAEGSPANPPGAIQAEPSKPRTFWSGVVTPKRLNVDLLMNITLTRTSDGMPKFFNCALTAK